MFLSIWSYKRLSSNIDSPFYFDLSPIWAQTGYWWFLYLQERTINSKFFVLQSFHPLS